MFLGKFERCILANFPKNMSVFAGLVFAGDPNPYCSGVHFFLTTEFSFEFSALVSITADVLLDILDSTGSIRIVDAMCNFS